MAVTGLSAVVLLSSSALLPAAHAGAGAAGPARPAAPPPRPVTEGEALTAAHLDTIRGNPSQARDFFLRMPKGGDLHNHLSGAVRTEYLVELAAEDGLCIDTSTMTAVTPPCGSGTRPAADARTDRAFHDAIVRAWSMQDFPADGNGHDHFFDTFGKFGEVTWRHRGKLLAEVADDVAKQNQFYLETLVTPASEGAKQLAAEVGWDADLARLHEKLTAGGKLDRLVTEARKETDDSDAEFRAAARCDTDSPRPACRIPVRWISQVSRGSAPERVFTQMALGMRLAERDARFVAVNLVQPEDAEVALRDYSLQMRMLEYLRGVYPQAHVTLHAGELWPGLVKPADLAFHIREAVEVAGADRIGHGVDLVHEDDWQRTARTMAARETAVEVPFTSNAQILGVRGDDHPFETYRAYGVPVVLATDDPGVSRIDISHEYRYAADTYGLSYPELKDLARASLEYAFLPGASLWRGNPTRDGYRPVSACQDARPGAGRPGADCRRLLDASPKATAQWEQERAFQQFERTFRAGR
ncbi:adenosine deaminase [Streptomyces sp. DSM 41972]|uniref:adenosine deaminase n=1 Tax=Streptomyces althioticus subsp. attaecolombicae TaxID=3075534 RepID=A0ABU3HYR5_9ACTN|nr:adenosine deaminase [Streptomyces sp. DSM 41972]SCD47743.1 adenosine deaminase [Streptomyces sp. di50b]SCE25291.1 adenosine deaminase [Streptomyces sp. di188]